MSNSSLSVHDVVSVTYHQQKLQVDNREVWNLDIILITEDGSQVTVQTFSDERQSINQEG